MTRRQPREGARYNSAVRYVHTMRSQFGYASLAVVVSKDGMVDLVPQLMPRIPRAGIDDALAKLRELAAEEIVEREEFDTIIGWLDAHRFYLFRRDAESINGLIDLITPKIAEDGHSASWLRFAPNPDLDMTYFEGVD